MSTTKNLVTAQELANIVGGLKLAIAAKESQVEFRQRRLDKEQKDLNDLKNEIQNSQIKLSDFENILKEYFPDIKVEEDPIASSRKSMRGSAA